MKIDEQFDTDYETVKIEHVGLIDPLTGGIFIRGCSFYWGFFARKTRGPTHDLSSSRANM